METLPHELVAAIGDNLMPKWRCRLFMCCKLWRDKCFWPQKYVFDWCRNIYLVNKSINSMQYDAYSHVINKSLYCTRSLRTNINGSRVGYYHLIGITIDTSIGCAFCIQCNEFYTDNPNKRDHPLAELPGYYEINLINNYYEVKERKINEYSLHNFVRAYNEYVVLL